MSTLPPVADPAVARHREAETLHAGSSTIRLLLDADATGGALSAHRVRLGEGAIGANPHRHSRSSEAFYVLSGSVDMLAGERVTTAVEGDLVVVPPGVAHAFAASAESNAELLVLITPGVQRFDFFRELVRVMNGQADRAAFMRSQPDYDTYPADSADWSAAR
jgi:quercetin dioxygenase-like cupin family protein